MFNKTVGTILMSILGLGLAVIFAGILCRKRNRKRIKRCCIRLLRLCRSKSKITPKARSALATYGEPENSDRIPTDSEMVREY